MPAAHRLKFFSTRVRVEHQVACVEDVQAVQGSLRVIDRWRELHPVCISLIDHLGGSCRVQLPIRALIKRTIANPIIDLYHAIQLELTVLADSYPDLGRVIRPREDRNQLLTHRTDSVVEDWGHGRRQGKVSSLEEVTSVDLGCHRGVVPSDHGHRLHSHIGSSKHQIFHHELHGFTEVVVRADVVSLLPLNHVSGIEALATRGEFD